MAFICTRPNKCANWQSLVCRCPLFAFRPPLIGRRFKNSCYLLFVKELNSLFLLSDFVFFSCVFYLILRFFLCLLSDLVCSWYGPGNKKGHEPLNSCPHFRRKCSYSLRYLSKIRRYNSITAQISPHIFYIVVGKFRSEFNCISSSVAIKEYIVFICSQDRSNFFY